MTIGFLISIVLLGSFLLKRRGDSSETSWLKEIFHLRVVEEEHPAKAARPDRPHSPERKGRRPARENPPLALLSETDGYGIELNSSLTDSERVQEIVGLQNLLDSSDHNPAEEPKIADEKKDS